MRRSRSKAARLRCSTLSGFPGTHSPSNPVAATCRSGRHGEWQTHPLGARPRGYVCLPCRGAAGCNDAGHKLPIPGAAWIPKQSRISAKFADVTWNSVLLYPAGYFSRDIKFETALRLPEGWKFACALDVKSQNGNQVQFKETTLNTLVDSPLYAGPISSVSISPLARTTRFISMSSPTSLADLEITPEELQYPQEPCDRSAEAFQLASLRSL